ncbi:MAG: PEGA domain-containing protein [Candidatus Marinimicrobia bacterium]|nr:PEGA domain-containing protein [Candidatus Neomarinimicrobiota bacterium]
MSIINRNRVALFSLLFVFGFLYCQSADKLNVAVIDLETQGGLSPQEASILTSRLRSNLVSTNVFNVLDRGLMDEILEEQGFQQSGCTSAECVVEIGKMLNMHQMITGSIGKLGSMYTLDIVQIDVETSRIIKSLTRDYLGEIEGLIKLMGSLANELAGIAVAAEPEPVVAEPVSTQLGAVTVSSTPPGAAFYINGIKVGLTPFRLDELAAGSHQIKLSKPDYIDHSEEIIIAGGQTLLKNVALIRLNILTINSDPDGASFYLDGELKGRVPQRLALNDSEYSLKLSRDGYADWEQTISLQQDYTQTIALLELFTIDFSSKPVGAEIYFDNKYLGTTPLTHTAPQGPHIAKLHLNNYEDVEQSLKLKKNTSVKAKLKFTDEYKRQLKLAKRAESGGFPWLLVGSATAAIIGGGAYYYLTTQEDEPVITGSFPQPPARP